MAIPDTFKFIFVALVAMVAYRFVNEMGLVSDAKAPAVNGTDTGAEVTGHDVDSSAATANGKAVKVKKKGFPPRPMPKLRKDQVLIEYCTSWSYKGTFNQVVMIIQQRALDNLEVRGAEYPVPPEKQFYAQCVFYVQMALFAMVFCGETILGTFKIPVPSFLEGMRQNMFASFMGIWLVGNIVASSFLSTGAFEIYHGDQLIWSSLEAGRLPTMADLLTSFAKTGVEFMHMRAESP